MGISHLRPAIPYGNVLLPILFLFLYPASALSQPFLVVADSDNETIRMVGSSPYLTFCSTKDCPPADYRGFLWAENVSGTHHLSLGTSYTNATGQIRFYTGANALSARIMPSGFVGIGTTPSYRLHVVDSNGTAINGQSTHGYGLYGTSTNSVGVVGSSSAAGSAGVHGVSPYIGVQGITTNNTADTARQGVRGDNYGSNSGWAGYFYGNLGTSGTLVKGGGAFRIDHPLEPETKYLYHSFVESPDMKNIYDGVVETDGEGRAEVELPEWFEALNGDFRYQLTVIGRFAQAIVAEEIEENRFVIATDQPHTKVSWQVTGIRRDAYAEANRIPVEAVKPPHEAYKFLHPELFGAPPELAVDYVWNPPNDR